LLEYPFGTKGFAGSLTYKKLLKKIYHTPCRRLKLVTEWRKRKQRLCSCVYLVSEGIWLPEKRGTLLFGESEKSKNNVRIPSTMKEQTADAAKKLAIPQSAHAVWYERSLIAIDV
jgi:hypothetical protein